jgi:cell wall-associated NlpC family hydrolase
MRSATPLEKREAIVSYILKFIGQPYKWTGNGKHWEGFDCSGLICEVLWSIGVMDRTDRTAQSIFELFKAKHDGKFSQEHGNLIFFGKDIHSITHIGLTLNAFQYVEAGGGDSRNLDGMVRIRPQSYRSDVVAIVDFLKE